MSHICRKDMTGFDTLSRLPAGNPERADVEGCPRCGSLFLEYQAFMRAGESAGSDGAAAQRHLTAFIESAAASELAQPKRPAPRVRLVLPRLGWVVPVAAVLVVAAIGIWRMQPGIDRASHVRAVDDAASIAWLSMRSMNGAVELTWEPVATADAYAIRLLDSSFTEVRRHPSATATTRVDYDEAEGILYCQVVALQAGDEIAASAIRSLSTPESR